MIGRVASSLKLHGWPPRCGSPKLMQPRQIFDTSSPVEPSLRYSMEILPLLSATLRTHLTSGRGDRPNALGQFQDSGELTG